MKVSSYAVARPVYSDRNSTSVLNTYSAVIGPHAQTQRWGVTLGAGRKATMEGAWLQVIRITAAAVVAQYNISLNVTSGATTAVVGTRDTWSNTTLVDFSLAIPINVTVYPGEMISVATLDGSTGGTVYYVGSGKITTYDA